MNVDEEDYGTEFKHEDRNGWENEVGSPDGILKTEAGPFGPNTYWSGKLEWRPPHIFQPSLYKVLNLPVGEKEKGSLFVSIKYRVHPPEPGDSPAIALVITKNISESSSTTWIEANTPTGEWRQTGDALLRYSGSRAHILIGTNYGDGPGVSRKIDIDDIKVVRVPDDPDE
ncbi:hypothetical protein HX866_31225 [Pseudomonas gingeri]|uniref:hypothetical protein n=1 Tax=Pseudomonas gingeri TaxID=117681 RepID=UPI0015A3F1E7|nr:hypothetical protein [Pseudomonas gingeri]NWA29366.1 hypothetical protein [Pseudomonas gingeri]NWD78081.1 hypothetical protein [Pseudomonas gingeri]